MTPCSLAVCAHAMASSGAGSSLVSDVLRLADSVHQNVRRLQVQEQRYAAEEEALRDDADAVYNRRQPGPKPTRTQTRRTASSISQIMDETRAPARCAFETMPL